MATQPAGEANQVLWDETLRRLMSLSSVTVQRNVELEARVKDLEVELAVWKQAHSAVVEVAERQSKAHNVQIATLNRQISNMDNFKGNQDPLIFCVINGNEKLFSQALLLQGQHGGKIAAQQITKAIADYLSNEDIHIFGRLSFWITIFFSRVELASFLATNEVCAADQLEGFLSGFSQSSPRFLTVDVGYAMESVELKVKEYLQTFTRFSNTLRVFSAGCDSTNYAATFDSLNKDQLLGKLVSLHGNDDPSLDTNHAIPCLRIDELFMSRNVNGTPTSSNSYSLVRGSYGTLTTNGGLISPQSPNRIALRLIDPSLPLHKQNPPPCNEHYLMSCSKGATSCKYSHDYILTPEQLDSLASNAKKAPCNWLKNGLKCPFGDRCCWGHVCPNGSKCFHLSKGKCWFKGESMHPPNPSPSPS